MSNTVFILGAGASKEAGAPVMREFVTLARDIYSRGEAGADKDSFDIFFRAVENLRRVYGRTALDTADIESVSAAFEMGSLCGMPGQLEPSEAERLSPAICRVIARTLEKTILFPVRDGKPQPPEPYAQFARLLRDLKPHSALTIATFNYDIAIDYALTHAGLEYNYFNGRDTAAAHTRPIHLLKLHGSLNWARCNNCAAIADWQLENARAAEHWRRHDAEAAATLEISTQLEKLEHCGACKHFAPMLVPPSWNKAQYRRELGGVWRQAACDLSAAENIFVIGYSLPETDYFFRFLYTLGTVGERSLRRFWVFNPDNSAEVRARYLQLLGEDGRRCFRFEALPFSRAIGVIAETLEAQLPARPPAAPVAPFA